RRGLRRTPRGRAGQDPSRRSARPGWCRARGGRASWVGSGLEAQVPIRPDDLDLEADRCATPAVAGPRADVARAGDVELVATAVTRGGTARLHAVGRARECAR